MEGPVVRPLQRERLSSRETQQDYRGPLQQTQTTNSDLVPLSKIFSSDPYFLNSLFGTIFGGD